jgi:ryanodine receptor 2
VLEQALSVRALQEIVSASNGDNLNSAQQSGYRTLLYGHAVLLRHLQSNMVRTISRFLNTIPKSPIDTSFCFISLQYLTCLSTSTSNDKLAFDVGLQYNTQGESCWWTLHPASKQRSEGEKVRIGDDIILVSVASERYLVSTRSEKA